MEKLSEALEAVAAVRYLVNTFLICSGVVIGTAFSSSLRLIKGYKCT